MSRKSSYFKNVQLVPVGRLGQWQPSFPSLYVSPVGTVSVLLRDDVVVEMTAGGNVRIVKNEKCAAAMTKDGSVAAIMHPLARILQENRKFYCQFGGDRLAVMGSEGIVFSSKRFQEALLVSSTTVKGAKMIPLSVVQYPSVGVDFTISALLSPGGSFDGEIPECEKIVEEAHYEVQENGVIIVHANDFFIRQEINGKVNIVSLPKKIQMWPNGGIMIKSEDVEMGIQAHTRGSAGEEERSFVKWGSKRIHSCRNRIVVSDGICTASMDRFGRLLSS